MKSIQMDELRIENKIWFEKLKNFNNDEQKNKNNYMTNKKKQTEFLTTIYEGLTEICKTTQEQNLSDEEFKEKVFTFLRTPEEGRQKRSQIREMAEYFVIDYYERYENKLPKDYKETLPSFVMKVMPVVIRFKEQRKEV
jgi:hypothetical protein